MSIQPFSMPSVVGRYRLLGRLGSGGMAHVHLAAATGPLGFAKLVVLKVLRPELADVADSVAMFLDEARLAARLSHPNIVHVFEVGEEDGLFFLAMEHLDGQPLHRVGKRLGALGAMTAPLAVHVTIGVLEGLHHAHELRDASGTPLGVVHRDVSPQNVFVTYDGTIKVVDFGIAKVNDATTETRFGIMKGKLPYMAPEQARGDRVDRRTDVFACGALLFEMLSGQRLWEGFTDPMVAARLVRDELPDVRALAAHLPPRLVEVLVRALAADPDARYASADAMRIELEKVLASSGAQLVARDVAAAMAVGFSAEREALERQVREGMVAIASEPTPLSRSTVTPIAFGKPTVETDTMQTRLSSRGALIPESKTKPVGVRRRRGGPRARLAGYVSAALAILLLGGGGGWLLTRESERAEAPDAAPAARVVPESIPDACHVEHRPVVVLEGDVEETTELGCDREYLIKHVVFVRSGATLRIAPGTLIRGDHETMGTLVVEPGARIVAEGTASDPIVFTSAEPIDRRAPGDWGGLILLGRAPTNAEAPEVEGLIARGAFGGESPDDSSGVLSYVRVEYAGRSLAPNNEINGLTLAGVGRGTRIDHVQVRSPLDDCFEFFGGTVSAHHLICDAPGDDGFDWDLGYVGELQFLLFRDDVTQDGSNALEGDGDAGGGSARPRSDPRIWNVTACAGGGAWNADAYGVLVRNGSQGRIGGALFLGFGAGVDLRDRRGGVEIVASRFVGASAPVLAHAEGGENQRRDDDFGFDEVAWLGAPESAVVALADRSIRWTATPGTYKPEASIPSGRRAPPNDGILDPRATFVGAFRDRADRWDQEPWVVMMSP